jgi:hypothetical protein
MAYGKLLCTNLMLASNPNVCYNHVMLNCNTNLLKAKIFHNLKSIANNRDALQPRLLESLLCEVFGFNHVGNDVYFADGVLNNVQISIKTRTLDPTVLKTKPGRDFQTNPEKFLGVKHNKNYSRCKGGLGIVQRRQSLPFDETVATPEQIGHAVIAAFTDNINHSYEKFQTDTTYEIIAVHGYDHTEQYYLMDVYWQEYQPLDASKITWFREGSSVVGSVVIDGLEHVICKRIDGNATRESTCFKEYKNLIKFANSVKITVPVPGPWQFDMNTSLDEIKQMEKLRMG